MISYAVIFRDYFICHEVMIPMRTNQDSIGMLKMGFERIFCELILADTLCDLGAKLTGGFCQMAE